MEQFFNHEYIISSVQFNDELIEVTFFDKEKQGDSVAKVETLIVSTKDFQDTINVIFEELEDLINEAEVMLRNPPKKLNPRDRLRQGLPAREDSDDPVEEEPADAE